MAKSTSLTPKQRSLRAAIAAHTRWQNEPDPQSATLAARTKFDQRFYDEVDPDRTLDPDERERRAAHARSAYFKRLAFRASKTRSAKVGSR